MRGRGGEYSGAFDCFVKLIKNEGVFALWKGFTPYFLRIGPHTILTFLFLEQLNKLFAKYYMKEWSVCCKQKKIHHLRRRMPSVASKEGSSMLNVCVARGRTHVLDNRSYTSSLSSLFEGFFGVFISAA